MKIQLNRERHFAPYSHFSPSLEQSSIIQKIHLVPELYIFLCFACHSILEPELLHAAGVPSKTGVLHNTPILTTDHSTTKLEKFRRLVSPSIIFDLYVRGPSLMLSLHTAHQSHGYGYARGGWSWECEHLQVACGFHILFSSSLKVCQWRTGGIIATMGYCSKL